MSKTDVAALDEAWSNYAGATSTLADAQIFCDGWRACAQTRSGRLDVSSVHGNVHVIVIDGVPFNSWKAACRVGALVGAGIFAGFTAWRVLLAVTRAVLSGM